MRNHFVRECIWTHVIIALFTNAVTVSSVRYSAASIRYRSSNDRTEDAAEGYPILDAVVASGWLRQSLSWRDVVAVEDCDATLSRNGVSSFVRAIPEVITKALRKADRDQGRIVEYTNETFELGENYGARVRGVTLSCFVVLNEAASTDSGTALGPAAYASQIVASNFLIGGVPLYNLSMMIEADVVELGASGMLYVPKKYCFDVSDYDDYGIARGSAETAAPLTSKSEWNRPVLLGAQPRTLTSYRNRVYWMRKTVDNVTKGPQLMLGAYYDPKAELIALANTIDEQAGISCWTYEECFDEAAKTFDQYGLQFDANASYAAVTQYKYMVDVLSDWRSFVEENNWVLEIDNVTYGDNIFPAPLIYDKSIASKEKNSLWPAIQANPYYSRDALIRAIGVPEKLLGTLANCVDANGNHDTSAAEAAAYFWPSAIKRRLNEHAGRPLEQMHQWSLYSNGAEEMTKLLSSEYLKQNLTWGVDGQLGRGNLTEKIMGKTAQWLMVTSYVNGTGLSQLLEAEKKTNAFEKTTSKAVVVDNPCAEVASNMDIYLLILGMALAACGAVNAVILSVHHTAHWAVGKSTIGTLKQATSVYGWRRFLPTYELLLVIVGAGVFISLYIPAFLQVAKEVEVASFGTSEVDMEVKYGPRTDEAFGGRPALVTVTHTDSTCIDARPGLLMFLSIFGLILGLLINAPFICRANEAMVRYCNRLYRGEETLPKNCSVHDNTLRLLVPPEPEEDIRDNETETNVLVAETGDLPETDETGNSSDSIGDTNGQSALLEKSSELIDWIS